MSKKYCGLVRDLLPLYAEDMCSEESRVTVAEHLAGCAECSELLRKMNTDIHVKASDDVAVIKRIKRRIRIEKIIITAVTVIVLLFALWLLLFSLLNSTAEMNYERYGFSELITTELDENGDLWLVRDGMAKTAEALFPTLSDANGNHFGYDQGFDQDTKMGMGYTLMQRRIDAFASVDTSLGAPERTLICNINENPEITYVFYYEAKSDTEHILWERNES